jgi:hypothetical protein
MNLTKMWRLALLAGLSPQLVGLKRQYDRKQKSAIKTCEMIQVLYGFDNLNIVSSETNALGGFRQISM